MLHYQEKERYKMFKLFFTLFSLVTLINALEIQKSPIEFGDLRIKLTQEYIKMRYNLDVSDITIVPQIVMIHYTGVDDFAVSKARLEPSLLPSDRPDISRGGAVNVSAHFLVERDGTIHQLMPLDFMARHVIGLNYSAIGIENVGGANHKKNLTAAQLLSNIKLIRSLKEQFPTIAYVAGHSEYRCFEKTELWLEKDTKYRTQKQDPGDAFMKELRSALKGFKGAPCD